MTTNSTTMTFTKKPAPDWLLAFWKEIDDKTFGKGFDCFVEDATCNLGVADWRGRRTSATTCAPLSTPVSPPSTTWRNIGTAERSRSSAAP